MEIELVLMPSWISMVLMKYFNNIWYLILIYYSFSSFLRPAGYTISSIWGTYLDELGTFIWQFESQKISYFFSMVALTMISKLHCMPNGGQNFNAKFGWKCFAKHILCFFGKSWHLNTLVPALMWFPCRQKSEKQPNSVW